MKMLERTSLIAALLAVGGMATLSHAAPVAWDAGGDGTNWSDGANWNPDGVPVGGAGGNEVTLGVAAAIDLNGPQSARLLTFSGNTGVNITVANTGGGGLTLGAGDITSTPASTGVLTRTGAFSTGSTVISTPLTFLDVGTTGGSTLIAIDGSGSFTFSGPVDFTTQGNGGTGLLDTGLISNLRNAAVEFSGIISGNKFTRRLNINPSNGNNTGSLKLSAANTFTATGGIYINPSNGTLYLANNSAFGTAANAINLGQADNAANATAVTTTILITDSATLDTHNTATRQHGIWVIGSDISGTATYSGTLKLGSNSNADGVSNLPVKLTAVTADTTTVFSNVISNNGTSTTARWSPVEKIGLGLVKLTTNNTYTGTTTVKAGTLEVNGNLASSAVTVDPGATLRGTGNIANGVTVSAGGTLAPGNSIGTLTVGSAIVNGSFAVELAPASVSDLLNVTGELNITNATLDLTDLGGAFDGSTYIIAAYGSLTGSQFFAVNGLLNGYTVDYNYQDGNQIALVVPEPATLSLLALGGLMMVTRRRLA